MEEVLIDLRLGDCLEIMQSIPDKSVDAIICDLPYGTTACKWDSIIPFEPLWGQYKRIIKDNGAIVLTASQPFTSALVMSNPKWFKYEWIWQKNRGSNFASLKYQPMKEHESVLIFCKSSTKYFPIKQERSESGKKRIKTEVKSNSTGSEVANIKEYGQAKIYEELRNPSSIQKFNTEVGFHPTQKPVALMEYFVKTYTNDGDTVLDNCMGSGTTGVACKNLGRKFIGIEQDANYFEVAKNRIYG